MKPAPGLVSGAFFAPPLDATEAGGVNKLTFYTRKVMPQLQNEGFNYLLKKGISLEYFNGSAYDPAKVTAAVAELLATPAASSPIVAAPAPASPIVSEAAPAGQPWGDEPWADWFQRQCQKAAAIESRAQLAEGIITRAHKQLKRSFDIGEIEDADIRAFGSVLEAAIHAAWKSEATVSPIDGGAGQNERSKDELLASMGETNRVLAARLQAAAVVLEGYEKWEGSVLEEDAAWANRAGQPWGTEELYGEWMELQAQRNAVLYPGQYNQPDRDPFAAGPVSLSSEGGGPIMTAEQCLAEVRERLLNHSQAEEAHLIAVDLPELISLVIGPLPQPAGPVSLMSDPSLTDLPF